MSHGTIGHAALGLSTAIIKQATSIARQEGSMWASQADWIRVQCWYRGEENEGGGGGGPGETVKIVDGGGTDAHIAQSSPPPVPLLYTMFHSRPPTGCISAVWPDIWLSAHDRGNWKYKRADCTAGGYRMHGLWKSVAGSKRLIVIG